ncbi:DUF4167 domain-containing protein [Dongia sp. agr-C8]
MRPNNQNRRGRGRGPRKPHGGPHGGHGGGGQGKGHNYDSAGPDIRVRGNAYQVLEKYLQLARDAGTAGDRVAAENFLQHADHYYRVVAAQNEGQRPRIGGREISVADVNVQNVSQGLSAALSGHGHGGDESQHGGENQQGGHGNGQMRPNQNSGEQNHPNQQSQSGGQPQNVDGGDQGSGENGGDGQGFVAPDEQPDYPEELIPADGANAGPREGQQQDGRHQGRGRGRRRGPGRRVRNEGDEGAAPAPQQAPGEGQ